MELNNENIENFLKQNLEHYKEGKSFRLYRAHQFLEAIFESFNLDNKKLSYKEEIIKFENYEYLLNYYISHPNKEKIKKLEQYVFNFVCNDKYHTSIDSEKEATKQEHGFNLMEITHLLKNY